MNFLEEMNFDYVVRGQDGLPPRFIEFPVEAETAPYLVSSTRSALWVSKPSVNSTLRAAVRPRAGFLGDILRELVSVGVECQWGNVHPVGEKGFSACLNHLKTYGLVEIDILAGESALSKCEAFVASSADWDGQGAEAIFTKEKGLDVRCVSWAELPSDLVVFVPRDRLFLGFVGSVGSDKLVSVIHNPSRGIALAYSPNGDHAKMAQDGTERLNPSG